MILITDDVLLHDMPLKNDIVTLCVLLDGLKAPHRWVPHKVHFVTLKNFSRFNFCHFDTSLHPTSFRVPFVS